MSGSKNYTCINCPLGCRVTVKPGRKDPAVSGHECGRGKEYALQEYLDPRRMLTGTVRVSNGLLPRLPVKTAGPLPKGSIIEAARSLDRITIEAPVSCGAVVAVNLAGSGVDLVATRDLERKQ